MPADPYWECIRCESEILSEKNYSPRPLPPGVFEPGDFAFHQDSLHHVFVEYLEKKRYHLHPAEQRTFGKTGRYCVVLRRLGADKYVVCYLATFGGARDFRDIKDPVGQYFGVPLGGRTYWPGVAPLKTVPPWKANSGRGFILGIPVIREGLQKSNLGFRFRLSLPDLHRLETLFKERDKKFDQHAEEIRRKHVNWLLTMNASHLTSDIDDLPVHRSDPKSPIDRERHPYHARWLALPTQQQNLSWVMQYMERDISSRSIYLNTLPSKRPKRTKFPKPYFASCLRTSVATITRLIR